MEKIYLNCEWGIVTPVQIYERTLILVYVSAISLVIALLTPVSDHLGSTFAVDIRD